MLRLTATIALCRFACGKSAKPNPEPLKAGDIAFVGATVVPLDREDRHGRPGGDRGHHVYEVSGTHGSMDLSGRFSVDADGAPHEIELKVKWGTFVTTRID